MHIPNICCTFATEFINEIITYMKKILYVALMALVTMSCNHRNSPDIPKEDQSLLNNASKNAISILGVEKATAEQRIIKAGFTKVDTEEFFFSPQRRVVSVAKQRMDDEDVSCFVYNIADDVEDEEEIVNAIIESKQTAVIFMTTYINGILANIHGTLIVGAEVDNVNGLFLDCSESLHSNVSGLAATWYGSIKDKENDGEEQEYYKYKEYTAALYPLNSLFAEETGAGTIGSLFDAKGFGYHLTWDKPDEDETRWQINNEGYKAAIATGAFSITYSDPSMY